MVEVVRGPHWGFARAELGTSAEQFCSQGDPKHSLPRRAQVRASHKYFAWEIQLEVHKTQQRKAVQLRRGKQVSGSSRSCRSCARKREFQFKIIFHRGKARQKLRVWQGVWLLSAQPSVGSKPQATTGTAEGASPTALSGPGHSQHGGFCRDDPASSAER